MILDIFCSGPFDTNMILLGCSATKKAAVFDVPFESTRKLMPRLKQHGLALEKILLTHSHWDHIAEVKALKQELNIPVYVHEADAGNLEHPGTDGLPLFFSLEGVKPDGYLRDGETIFVGKLKIKIIHTPGHSPGSVCFYLESEKLLISGDTLFRGTIGNLSFPTSRPELMWHSLKKLAALPVDTKVIPGHGGTTTIGAESWIAEAQKRFGK